MTAALRRLAQTVVSAVLAYGPVPVVIARFGWDVTPAQVTLWVLPVVMLGYTQIGDWLQSRPFVTSNPALSYVVGVAMGGRTGPTYTNAD